MQVFRTLAGYSYGRADVVRRAMSKKKRDVMESEREIFINGLKNENGELIINGAVRNGIDAKTANDVFSDMISFASYGFNKSHTAAYGLIAYRTAYLKVMYPKVFMAALLTSVIGDESKTVVYINECNRLRINVLSPHVNRSTASFDVQGNDIVFSLLGIKNIGRALIDKIVRVRKEDGPFKSYWDFCKRVSGQELNRRALECLIKAGALDGLDLNRKEMLQNIDLVIECAAKENDMYAGGQLDLFSSFGAEDFSNTPVFAKFNELPKDELLSFEKEVAGLYFSGHPLEEYREVSQALKCPQTNILQEYVDSGREKEIDNKQVRFVCIVNSVKKKVTKRDETMAFCVVEDLFGSVELIVFPKIWMAYTGLLKPGSIILVDGKLSVKDDEIKLIAEKVTAAPKSVENTCASTDSSVAQNGTKKKKTGFFLRLQNQNQQQIEKIKGLLSMNKGNLPVYLYFNDTKAYHYMGAQYHSQVNSVLKAELDALLGADNVVIRE